jgi:hypothetical protein
MNKTWSARHKFPERAWPFMGLPSEFPAKAIRDTIIQPALEQIILARISLI